MKKRKIVIIIFWATVIGVVAPQVYVFIGNIAGDLVKNMWGNLEESIIGKFKEMYAPIEEPKVPNILTEEGMNQIIVKKSLIPDNIEEKMDVYAEEIGLPNPYASQELIKSLRNPYIDKKMYEYCKQNDLVKDEVYLENTINTESIEEFRERIHQRHELVRKGLRDRFPKRMIMNIIISLMR